MRYHGSYKFGERLLVRLRNHAETELAPTEKTDPFEDISFDYLVDTAKNLFVGSAETVRQMIEDFHDEIGGFGLLMFHCGRPYATPEKFQHSMRLFARDVAPKLAAIDADAVMA